MKNLTVLFVLVFFYSCQHSNMEEQINNVKIRTLSDGHIHNSYLTYLHNNFASKSEEMEYTINSFSNSILDNDKLAYYKHSLNTLDTELTDAWRKDSVQVYINNLVAETTHSIELKSFILSIFESSTVGVLERDLLNNVSNLDLKEQVIARSLIDVYFRSYEYWADYSKNNSLVIGTSDEGNDIQGISIAAAIDMAAFMYVHSGTEWGDNWRERDHALASAAQVSALVVWLCCG